jgi:hypothetical protein
VQLALVVQQLPKVARHGARPIAPEAGEHG